MDGSLITYEALYDILRREKSGAELVVLDKDFFEKVLRYLKEKNDILESQRLKDSVFASDSIKKTKKQVENIQKILKEIYERRESKLLQLAIACSRTGNKILDKNVFLKEENILFNDILLKLDEFRHGVIENLIEGREVNINTQPKRIKIEEEAINNIALIRFIGAVPRFLGTDLKEYGPFRLEESASIPKRVAEVLIKTKRAEEI